MAAALAVSMTLPPPIAATTSARCSRAAAAAALARSTVGSPATGNTAVGRPSRASRSACRSGLAPVQASTREPYRARSPGSSADRPAPNMTRPAVANSNASIPALAAYPGGTAQPAAPAGKTAENFADARGSAIISATVSRQAA